MVSKNLSMGIKIVTLVKYWYLVGMSRGENLCIYSSYYYIYAILNHIDTRATVLRYEGSCVVYRPNSIEYKLPSNVHTLLVWKTVKSSLQIPEWYQMKMIPDQHACKPTQCYPPVQKVFLQVVEILNYWSSMCIQKCKNYLQLNLQDKGK
jgi:hypothetical protein